MAFDLNAIRAESQRLESGSERFLDNFVPMPEGEGSIVIRLLPPIGDEPLPFIATRTHKINDKNIHCPMNLVGQKWQGNCPICNWYRSLWKAADDASSQDEAAALIAEARAIKPNERYYYNCIVRKVITKGGDVQENVGPKIFSTGKKLQSKLLRTMAGDDNIQVEGLGDVTEPNGTEGRDLRVIKRLVKGEGDTKWPDYMESQFLNPSPLGTAVEINEWLTNRHDLTALRRILSQEELAREVRIHRKLEKDPQLSMDSVSEPDIDEEVPAKAKTRSDPVRPPISAQVQKPVASKAVSVKMSPQAVEEADEALADDDFLNKLKSM